jgi:serine phosphatase RsbU (regulator of sigma subunit)/Tfp pilus assembly protein PilF
MGKGIYTFYSFTFSLKTFVTCFSLFFTFFANHSLRAQKEADKINTLHKEAKALLNTDPAAALSIIQNAYELSEQTKNDTLIYETRFTRGIAYYSMGNLNSALKDFIDNRALAEKLNDPQRRIESSNAIANVYKDNERYDLALTTYREILELCRKKGLMEKTLLVRGNIAILYNCIGKYDSSIYITEEVLKALSGVKKQDYRFVSNLYGTLLASFTSLSLTDSVKKYTDTTLALKKYIGDNIGHAGNLFNLGSYYHSLKKYDEAEKYLRMALKADPDNLALVAEIKQQLASTIFEVKKYEEAALLYWQTLKLKDTINKIHSAEALSEMEVKYETGKKEAELKRLSAEKEVDDLKVKQSRIWLIVSIGGICIVVVVAVILFRQNQNRRQANKLLQQQNNEIVHQKKEITDSINYAKRIQLAILPPDRMVKRLLPNAFVFYKPKDVVSGDFYWMEEKNGIVMFAAVDCTGHGVPGAMMSVVGLNLLNQAVKEKGLTVPSAILQHLDTGVTETLRQSAEQDSIKDGMDLSLCSYDPKTLVLQYAGAFNNLWIVRKNISSVHQLRSSHETFFEEHLLEIKADKFPIGSNLDGIADNYTNHTFQLQKGDCVYLYSDGFADQFGGPKGKKFKYNALKKFLVSIHEYSPEEQKQKLLQEFESWRGQLEQIDDVLVMGVCV